MEGMEFQHHQPAKAGSKEEEAATIINKITSLERPLTEEEKEILRQGGYGDNIDEIDNHVMDKTIPPWMH